MMPTPVSALIHAATLVTAGLYLLLRSSPLLEYSSTALLIITLTGATTAFFAATCGLVQNDLKRIIAFSTISQLGYMVMAVGLSQYNVALMHVVNHAFFKALLFLGAGAVIHSIADEQDIRKMGGLIKFLPFTYTTMLVGSLSLLATPWLSGFYSKDLIIELAYGQYAFSGIYAYILGSLTDSSLGRKIYTFFNGKYFFDIIYNNYIIATGLIKGITISKVLDRGVVELVGPYGLASALNHSASNISKLDTGVITTYSIYITLSTLILTIIAFSTSNLALFNDFRLVFFFIT